MGLISEGLGARASRSRPPYGDVVSFNERGGALVEDLPPRQLIEEALVWSHAVAPIFDKLVRILQAHALVSNQIGDDHRRGVNDPGLAMHKHLVA